MSPSRHPPSVGFPPAICIQSKAHAAIALASGRPVTLLSSPAAAVFAGPAWWRALIASCDTAQPDILDCADAPGRALEAIALGCRWILLRSCPAWPEIAERAIAAGAVLLAERPANLDLASLNVTDTVIARHVEAWLQVG